MRYARGVATAFAVFAGTAAIAVSCTFPEINLTIIAGSGTGGESSGATASSAGGGGAGGETSTTSTTSTMSGTGGADPCDGGTKLCDDGIRCSCDCDNDTFVSWRCGGDDCADEDNRAHPDAGFQAGPSIKGSVSAVTQPFDFDCDKLVTKSPEALDCALGKPDCTNGKKGFDAGVACGVVGDLGHCDSVVGVFCKFASDNMTTIEQCK
jgi:hypothetical protein